MKKKSQEIMFEFFSLIIILTSNQKKIYLIALSAKNDVDGDDYDITLQTHDGPNGN